MAYRYKFNEPANKGFRRIARDQVELALHELAAEPVLPKGVHDVRKALKRLKALLRCVSPAMDAKIVRKRIATLSDIGKILAPQRDANISLEMAGKLAEHFGDAGEAALAGLTAHLKATAGELAGPLGPEAAAQVHRHLADESKRLVKIRLKGKGFDPLAKGIEANYRDGRRAFKKAYAKPSAEAFHALREAVQVHWRHMSLISNAWPEAFEARIVEAREISQILGDDHDIAIMEQFAAGLAEAEQVEISRLCKQRQNELREAAYFRAARLYAERPKAFNHRISEYWRSGTGMAALQRAQSTSSDTSDAVTAKNAAIPIESAPRLAAKTPGRGQSQSRA